MRTLLGYVLLFSMLNVSAQSVAPQPKTLAEVLSAGGQKLNAAQWGKVLPLSVTGVVESGVNTGFSYKTTYLIDGTFSGDVKHPRYGAGEMKGNWEMTEDGIRCLKYQALGKTFQSCNLVYLLDGHIYTVRPDAKPEDAPEKASITPASN